MTHLTEAVDISYGNGKILKALIKAIDDANIAMMSDEDAENLAEVVFDVLSSNQTKGSKKSSAKQDTKSDKQDGNTEQNNQQPEQPKFNDNLDQEFSKLNLDIRGRKGDIPNSVREDILDKYENILITTQINKDSIAKGRTTLVHSVDDLWDDFRETLLKYNVSPRQAKAIIRNEGGKRFKESLTIQVSDDKIKNLISKSIVYAMRKGAISSYMKLSEEEVLRLTDSVKTALNQLSKESSDESEIKAPTLDDDDSDVEVSDTKKSDNKIDWGEMTINAIDRHRASQTESLDEAAGLSKINKYLDTYDCACISAKKYLPSRQDFQSQKDYETEFKNRLGKQKKLDSKALQVELRAKFGGVIGIQGFYRYGTSEHADKEKSYFVVNRNLSEDEFKNSLLELACDAKQNSFFFSPKGTRSGYWIYTGIDLSEKDEIDKFHNKGDEEFVGTIYLGKIKQDDESTSYSLVNDRPFAAMKKDSAVVIDEEFEEFYGSSIHRGEGEYANRVKRVVEDDKKEKNKKGYTVSDDVGDITIGLNSFNSSTSGCCSEGLSSIDAIFHLNRKTD